jgi:transcriptional regulator with PAS, ATPase and Fis domain
VRYNAPVDTETLTNESRLDITADVEQPQLVLVVERARPLAGGALHSLANIDRVTIGRSRERVWRRVTQDGRRVLSIGVPDPRMSSTHATIERGGDVWTFSDCQSTNGSRVDRRRVDTTVLKDGDILELASTFLRFRAAVSAPPTARADMDFNDLPGLAAAMGTTVSRLVTDLEKVAAVARSDISMLLMGESGTGKEVLARAIHVESGRHGPFVPVNCGALPATLFESLLFGHKKGAFSGATSDELGFVRAAQGGTLFLDEVADLPGPSQAALLRVLQEKEVFPVGATRAVEVDVRVVAATHRSLSLLASSGQFRGDLLARIAAFTFELPPLRERMDDMGHLVARILGNDEQTAPALGFGADAVYSLFAHPWRNNVRELAQCLAVSKALATGDRVDTLRLQSVDGPNKEEWSARNLSPEQEELRAIIMSKLKENKGNVTHVAAAMGKARNQVHRWLKRFSLDPDDFRS